MPAVVEGLCYLLSPSFQVSVIFANTLANLIGYLHNCLVDWAYVSVRLYVRLPRRFNSWAARRDG